MSTVKLSVHDSVIQKNNYTSESLMDKVDSLDAEEILNCILTLKKRQDEFIDKLSQGQLSSLMDKMVDPKQLELHLAHFQILFNHNFLMVYHLAGADFNDKHAALLSIASIHSNVFSALDLNLIKQHLLNEKYPINILLLKNLEHKLIIECLNDEAIIKSKNFKYWMNEMAWTHLKPLIRQLTPQNLSKLFLLLSNINLIECLNHCSFNDFNAWITGEKIDLNTKATLVYFFIERALEKGIPITRLNDPEPNGLKSKQVLFLNKISENLRLKKMSNSIVSVSFYLEKIPEATHVESIKINLQKLIENRIQQNKSKFLIALSAIPLLNLENKEKRQSLLSFSTYLRLANDLNGPKFNAAASFSLSLFFFSAPPVVYATLPVALAISNFATSFFNQKFETELAYPLNYSNESVVKLHKYLNLGVHAAIGTAAYLNGINPIYIITLPVIGAAVKTDYASYLFLNFLYLNL